MLFGKDVAHWAIEACHSQTLKRQCGREKCRPSLQSIFGVSVSKSLNVVEDEPRQADDHEDDE